jgi:hypothetical protein
MPESDTNGVMVKLNDTHVILVGGNLARGRVWTFDLMSRTWSNLPDMQVTDRFAPFAGVVTYDDDQQALIVAGGKGQKSTELFNLTDYTWRFATNDLPVQYELYAGSSIQYDDTFLAVGGYAQMDEEVDEVVETIFRFNPKDESWSLTQSTLSIGRTEFSAFLVPNDYVEVSTGTRFNVTSLLLLLCLVIVY